MKFRKKDVQTQSKTLSFNSSNDPSIIEGNDENFKHNFTRSSTNKSKIKHNEYNLSCIKGIVKRKEREKEKDLLSIVETEESEQNVKMVEREDSEYTSGLLWQRGGEKQNYLEE